MKTLIYDIETTPILGYTWRAYDTNIIKVHRDWQMICFAYKWMNRKKIHFVGPDKADPWNDKEMVKQLWNLFNEADVIIGHNIDRFDIKKSNALFMRHGLTKPSPYKTVDTLKVARRNFANSSNRLGEIGELLGLGKKVSHEGFMQLFEGCMNENDPKWWRKMKRYNLRDVELTENVYKALLSWAPGSHPVDLDKPDNCPKCSSAEIQARGWASTKTYRYRRYQCMGCGSWLRGRGCMPLKKPKYIAL